MWKHSTGKSCQSKKGPRGRIRAYRATKQLPTGKPRVSKVAQESWVRIYEWYDPKKEPWQLPRSNTVNTKKYLCGVLLKLYQHFWMMCQKKGLKLHFDLKKDHLGNRNLHNHIFIIILPISTGQSYGCVSISVFWPQPTNHLFYIHHHYAAIIIFIMVINIQQ